MSGPVVGDFSVEQSAALHRRSSHSLAMGVASGMRRQLAPVPLFFERGDGPYLFDVDGHRLLDYTLGWGPLILGNNHPAINRAVAEQLSRAYAFGAQHRGEIELAELLVAVLPGVERVIFSNTGTEAVQAALRLARAFTGRAKVVKFEGHYHGWMNNVLVTYRPKASDPCTAMAGCGGQPSSEYSDTIVLPWNDLSAVESAFQQFPSQIAAVLTEPVLANGGSCLPRDGYLEGLVNLCRTHGAVSIFDEVITGFRLALGGTREYFGVHSDLSVYAKAIASGFAVSAVGGKAEIFDVLEEGRTIHAGTYNSNPVNLAAATATLVELRRPGVYERMHHHGLTIRATCERAAKRRGIALVTVGAGSLFSVHFGLNQPPATYRDVLAADSQRYQEFRLALLRSGVYVLPDGRWYTGAVHGQAELDLVLPAIEAAVKEIPT
ncbi:MAG: aspartate aminotransferase family protein [Burkholderiales bacterium]